MNATTPNEKQTALHTAAYLGELETVRVLIEGGANVQATGSNGETPLFNACRFNSPAVAALLLIKMAKVNVVCGGDTPLHAAVQTGNAALVELLLKHGADRNVSNAQGQTPLDLAVNGKHTKIIELLR